MNQDFEIKNGVLIRYHGAGGHVIIPDSVTSIGDHAFPYCGRMTSVKIPNSVTSIGNLAFGFCSGLTSVNIPNSVTSIGSSFPLCFGLISVNIPDSVTSIGDCAFQCCSSLPSVTIPDSVTSIGKWAFSDCESLTSVKIGNSVTSIGDDAFYGCKSLTSVTIPDSVTSIGDRAFYNCKSLTSVTLPDSVTIREDAFLNCDKLEHAPLMMIEKKMLCEPPKRNGVKFSKIEQLVQNHNYCVKMEYNVKCNLIFQMFALGLDEEGVSAYIRKCFKKMFFYLMYYQDTETMRKLLDSGKFITKQNIDRYIQYAINYPNHEIQLMLMDYKQKNNWYQDINKKLKL